MVQARTEIPRFARDDKGIQSAYSTGEDAYAYIDMDAHAYIDMDVRAYTNRRQLCMF